MATHLALLRGVNVGGRNPMPMAELRALCADLGHADVTTYIQSGNVLFTAADGAADGSKTALADALQAAIQSRFGFAAAVVVLTAVQLHRAVAANPFPDETDPKRLHAVFRREPLSPTAAEELVQALRRSRDKGSQDDAIAIESVLYLRTPDGMGRSELAAQLAKAAPARLIGGTARNWATVTTLAARLVQ